MKIHLYAIGQHMPGWVEMGYQSYAKRLPHECQLLLHELPLPKRSKTTSTAKLKQQEAELILKKIPSDVRLIALDEHGKAWSTQTLADELATWMTSGQDIALLIGGPDGLDKNLLAQCHATRSLSLLTLPHPMVRILVAEQIYRAWSLLNNHPYHRGDEK